MIVQVQGKAVGTVPQLLSAVAALKPGVEAELLVRRRSQDSTLTVVPGQRNPVRAPQ